MATTAVTYFWFLEVPTEHVTAVKRCREAGHSVTCSPASHQPDAGNLGDVMSHFEKVMVAN